MELNSWRQRVISLLDRPINFIRKVERYSLARAKESRLYRFGLACIVTSIFLALRIYLGHLIDSGPYILLIAGVLICALFAGAVAGIVATIIMAVAQLYFFSQPYLSLSLTKLSGSDVVGILTFVVVSAVMNLLLWGRRSAKGVAAETEEQFKAAFNQAAVGMSYTDMEGKWIQVNQTYARLMGYSEEELKHKTFEDLTHPDDINGSKELMRRLINGEGSSLTQQKRYIRKDGSEFWADITISMVRDSRRRPKYFVAVVQDVSARLEAEQRLIASEQEYRTIVETAEEGVWILDSNDLTKFVNSKMAKMLGYEVADLVGRRPVEFLAGEDEKVLRQHLELRHKGISEQYDLRWRRKDGSDLWTMISTTPVFTPEGVYDGALAMISDITKRKQIEEELENEHKRIFRLFEQAPAAIAILKGPTLIYDFANDGYMDMVGRFRDLIGKTREEAMPDLKGQNINEVFYKVYRTAERYVGNEVLVNMDRGDGELEERYFNVIYQPIFDDNKDVEGIFIHAVEVTRHVRAQLDLIDLNKEAKLGADIGFALTSNRSLDDKLKYCSVAIVKHLDASFARIWTLNEDDKTLELRASAGLYTHLDGKHGKVPVGKFMIGRIAERLTPHLTNNVIGDSEVHDQAWAKQEGMVAFAGYPLALNGKLVGVLALFAKRPLPDSTLATLSAVADEVALGIAQSKAHEQSIENAERLELAQVAGNIGTFEWDAKTNEMVWSKKLIELYGQNPDEFKGNFEVWMGLVYQEDRNAFKKALSKAVSKYEELNIEFRIVLPDGTARWMAARCRIHYDPISNSKRMIGIQRNISQRKRAESDLKFLTKASTVLASSLNYETTLKNIATLAVGELADWCTIDMLNDNGEIERIANATSSRIHPETAEFLAFPYQAHPEAKIGVPLVLRTGESALYQQLHTEELESLSQSPERLNAIERAGFSSAIIVPIQILGWAAGAISLSLIGPNRRYDEKDLALAESLAERASAAIDNAWLYKETQLAREELEQRVEERTQELLNKNAELNEAQSISHLGSWEWDVGTDERTWSAEMYRIYGLDPATFTPTTESIVEYSHPDDRERVRAEARAALLTDHGLFASEFRILRPSGEERNLFGQGRVIKDSEGNVIRMVGTVLDITDRKKIEQMKTDFVSLVSHQLKTPLAIIKGYTDNILMGIAGDLTDKQRQYLREMQGITTKYYYLIADLLNVSRIERGVISIDARPVDLIEIARAAAANHAERIKTKRLKLVFDLPSKPVIVLADQSKTMEAISNVIDNAIKFTEAGRIEIEVTADKDFGSVSISDSGRGMNRETVGKLFRKDQVFSGSPTPEGGSGLGLYIAKEFIRYQGGDVAVVSDLGRGSKFTFKVPLAKVKTGVK